MHTVAFLQPVIPFWVLLYKNLSWDPDLTTYGQKRDLSVRFVHNHRIDMLGLCQCDAAVCEQWTVCAACHRPISAFRAAAAIKTSELFIDTLDPVLCYSDVSRARLEKTAHLVRGGHPGAGVAAGALLDHLSTHFIFENLGKSALYLALALGADTFLAWLDRELTTASELATCAECAVDLDDESIRGLGHQLAESAVGRLTEISVAAMVTTLVASHAPLTQTDGGISTVRHALVCAERASLFALLPVRPVESTVARLLRSGTPISCSSFDPALHGTGDLMLSALWCHRHGMQAAKDELMFTLAPPSEVSVPFEDAADWGAFDLASTPIWHLDSCPRTTEAVEFASHNRELERPRTFQFLS
jgi:hypothetical protein